MSTNAPEPRSSSSGSSARRATAASSFSVGLLREADDAEVRLVHAQEQRRVRRDRAARSRPHASGSSCRPRRAVRRSGASTSGMRKPSPISISSPRETSTSRPSASAASASSIAAALLLTTIAASAPVNRRRIAATWSWREPREPVGEVVLEVRVAAADGDACARPRGRERRAAEVRVHDHAGRVQDPPESRARARAPARLERTVRSPGSAPARISSRARARTMRAASTASGSALLRASSSTEGRSRSSTPPGTIRPIVVGRRGRCFTVRDEARPLILLALILLALAAARCRARSAVPRRGETRCASARDGCRRQVAGPDRVGGARAGRTGRHRPRRRPLLSRPAGLDRHRRRARDGDAGARRGDARVAPRAASGLGRARRRELGERAEHSRRDREGRPPSGVCDSCSARDGRDDGARRRPGASSTGPHCSGCSQPMRERSTRRSSTFARRSPTRRHVALRRRRGCSSRGRSRSRTTARGWAR